ncbi:MAG: penicillin-binding protein 2 [Luteimonas sp.]
MQIRRRQLKNLAAEAEQFRRRAVLGFLVVLLSLGALGLWYFKLQVVDHEKYATQSEANRIKPRPIVPGRGLIYDRKGRILADNVPAYRLDVVPDQVGDPKQLIAQLGTIIDLSPDDIARFEDERRASRGFRAITLKLKVDEDEAARFAVDRWRYPGVELVPYLSRVYPHGDLLTHVIGYVGRIDKKDLEKSGMENSPFSHTGKTGIERYYEDALRGEIGYQRIETNVDGRALRTLGTDPATPGADLRLSIDLDLQQAMSDAFGEFEGAAVALDPRSGEILAMVSLPTYDANLFVNGISYADYQALNSNPSRPQFNRLVLGGVAPGSTLKPLLALAGLDSGKRRPGDKTLSTGTFRLPGQRGRGWGDSHAHGHGWTDVRKSIADSVNTYYYRLTQDMGVAMFDTYMTKYGFGAPTGIDLVGEIDGILPSPQSKLKLTKERWYPGDLVNASIGQGSWKVTPLQLARGTAALADRGLLRRPHLVAQKRNGFEAQWHALPQPAPVAITDHPANLLVVQEGMQMTVHGPGGTARAIGVGAPYRMAGKTGTAQVVNRRGNARVNPKSLPMHRRHRALFVGYAPAEAPTIAVAVMVEGGGFGASTAAPIARRIFDAWLLGTLPEPDPAAINVAPLAKGVPAAPRGAASTKPQPPVVAAVTPPR